MIGLPFRRNAPRPNSIGSEADAGGEAVAAVQLDRRLVERGVIQVPQSGFEAGDAEGDLGLAAGGQFQVAADAGRPAADAGGQVHLDFLAGRVDDGGA